MNDTLALDIPCAPEYVSVVRLTILGVASRLGFSYDAVEDIRLAVAEACTNAIARSRPHTQTEEEFRIVLRARIEEARLTVEVTDNIPPTGQEADTTDAAGLEDGDLGMMLMGLCMDEVATEQRPDGSTVRLIKVNDRTPLARLR